MVVVASSMSSDSTNPQNLLLPSSSEEGWVPMVRTGEGWQHWVEIDLRGTMR